MNMIKLMSSVVGLYKLTSNKGSMVTRNHSNDMETKSY